MEKYGFWKHGFSAQLLSFYLLELQKLMRLSCSVGGNLFYIFLVVLTAMMSVVLEAGYILYCITIRRGERAEYGDLFNGFSMAGKIILLMLLEYVFIFLWSLLFLVPGIVALYRYHFALVNLLENPDLSVMEALGMSGRQARGYKWQLFMLDVSYLGWILLAVLPDIIYEYGISHEVYLRFGLSAEVWLYRDLVSQDVFGVPHTVWAVLIPLWQLVVMLFYLPNKRCVELDYLDAAKRTSGLGANIPAGPGPGPDGSNGYDGGWSGGGYDGWNGGSSGDGSGWNGGSGSGWDGGSSG